MGGHIMGQTQKALTVDGAVAFTGLKKNYVYKLIHLKKIPYYKPAGRKGRVYFKQEELENFIFRNRQSADYEVVAEAADA
jgi:excisionase family DNA binding protein